MRWRRFGGKICPLGRAAEMDLVIFEERKSLIWEALQEGDFDYMESASEVFET